MLVEDKLNQIQEWERVNRDQLEDRLAASPLEQAWEITHDEIRSWERGAEMTKTVKIWLSAQGLSMTRCAGSELLTDPTVYLLRDGGK